MELPCFCASLQNKGHDDRHVVSRPVFKAVFKPSSSRLQGPSSKPSSSRLQDPPTVADLAPRGSENQNCGFQGVRVAAVTPFVV
jgi:hypothetical protein